MLWWAAGHIERPDSVRQMEEPLSRAVNLLLGSSQLPIRSSVHV
jgi:hypothetical protein